MDRDLIIWALKVAESNLVEATFAYGTDAPSLRRSIDAVRKALKSIEQEKPLDLAEHLKDTLTSMNRSLASQCQPDVATHD